MLRYFCGRPVHQAETDEERGPLNEISLEHDTRTNFGLYSIETCRDETDGGSLNASSLGCNRRNGHALLETGSGRDDNNTDSRDGKSVIGELMQTIERGNFEEIEKLVTPRGLQNYKCNTLLISMKVNYKLRQRAETREPDSERFQRLANSVEEFIFCLLDPLKTDPDWCKEFGEKYLDGFLNYAIEFEQKKFFTHPAVHSELNRKWRGRTLEECKSWQLNFFKFWCLFDLALSPILLGLFSLRNHWTAADVYLAYLKSPYYKFFRDTLSYIIMLLLHYAICLSPTTVAFSGLERTILVFYIGRFVVEFKQILCIKKWLRETENDTRQSNCVRIFSVYCSDCWNRFDLTSLVFYFIILILRIVTWFNDGSAANNRALAIAGYLYSFNTLCLTLRAFGQVMEQPKDVGTIQIALFSILRDVRTVLWQFLAVILAFSIAITKIYMSERSFIANESVRHKMACKEPGLYCWWAMFSHLGWSLLGRSEESGPMISVDPLSVLLAQIFYAAFLIMGVVLLINMLIALLSSTYQKTEENAVREWSFKRAITIQTYNGYDPIPVPLNIIYRIYRLLRLCTEKVKKEEDNELLRFVQDLEGKYFRDHANSFPVTDATKRDRVLRETERNRQMISQILYKTFASSNGDGRTPIHEWDPHQGIRMEGPLVMFDCTEQCFPDTEYHHHGARYRQPLSREFPHFEITIVETGEYKWLGIGITDKAYKTSDMPGWYEESLGYHTDDGNIFHNTKHLEGAIGTKGPAMARRGDRIGCTVLFEKSRYRDGKIQIPVFFTLNGSEIILEGRESPGKSLIFVDFEKPLFPFIGMTVGSRVLAKMCVSEDELQKDMSKVFDHIIYAREDVVRQSLEIQELKSDFADVRQEMNAKEDNMRHNMEDIVCNEVKKATKYLEDIVSNEVKKATKCLEEKLDALLVKLNEKDN